jgi:hypothetical protein
MYLKRHKAQGARHKVKEPEFSPSTSSGQGVRSQQRREIRGQKSEVGRSKLRISDFGFYDFYDLNGFNDLNVLNGFPCWEAIQKSVVRGQLSVAH